MLDDIDSLDLKISRHDKYRFETKLDAKASIEKKNVYKVETYFFIPKSLNVNFRTYKKDNFYNNIQNNIRFKTPRISIENLLDTANINSPFARIKKSLDEENAADAKVKKEKIIYEIKMFGCVLRGILRDNTDGFLEAIKKTEKQDADVLEQKILAFLEKVKLLTAKTKNLTEKISKSDLDSEIKQASIFLDEFFTLNLIEYFTLLLKKIRQKNIFQKIDNAISKFLQEQILRRSKLKYQTTASTASTNEALIYRRSLLKKFISSALFLDIKTLEFTPLTQVILGISAAAAMLFAAIVLVLAQGRFATDSIAFIAVLVISYIFKDRMKDWLKVWFIKSWTGWIADRKTKIYHIDPSNPIGVFKEAFSFVSKGSLSGKILKVRNIESVASIYEQSRPENIIKYEKKVTLNIKKTKYLDIRKKDLTDIMRFNIHGFLANSDDPQTDYLYYESNTDKLDSVKCLRTYHINVITKYTSYNGTSMQTDFERIRLVVTRDGILRLEEINVKNG